ncbi:ABC transporter permease [Thalassovita mangrovi]|uniref:Transport permease protein n=1 Tax=Thalassovita mangrovi TaxID=2692236 RepID=A0A6L8LRP6_9RHOB|nr:ABC transporter permease [Thalassovita mangrovi]MYM55839.1 ABC transporter permease [Thalassovita mangrovi]
MPSTPLINQKYVFPRSVMALMLREMSTTYGRSPGGYIWAFLEPLGGIVMMSVIFYFIARAPALGTNFPLYFATGFLPFMMYQSTAARVGQAIRYSKPLLSYPKVTYMDAVLARLLLNFLTQTVVTLILITSIVLIFDVKLSIDYVTCGHALFMAAFLGFAIGTVNCYLMSMFPIWQTVWSVVNRPLFLLSGIFFLIDPLPANFRSLLLYNPVAHPIMMMRRGIYISYDAVYVSELYVYSISFVLMAFGLLLLHRYHKIMMDEGA